MDTVKKSTFAIVGITYPQSQKIYYTCIIDCASSSREISVKLNRIQQFEDCMINVIKLRWKGHVQNTIGG